MGFIRKFFGGKKEPSVLPAPAPEPAAQATHFVDPSKDPNMIKVFDAFGREMFITREAWRDSVLKGAIEKAWSDADQLAALVAQCLQDNFVGESVRAGERLYDLDCGSERSSILLGVAYLCNKQLDKSEKILSEYTQRHGESGVVLTNLAKVFSARGEQARASETLWRALQLDPNHSNGLAWYEALHRDKGGIEAGQEALRRLAEVRGSWRAQLWLARHALEQKNLPQAMRLYANALSNVQGEEPSDLLMQMSGDLGNNGHIAELLEMAAPRFNADVHGLQVGNNLIKSYVDLGRLDDARRIASEFYAKKRPDWQKTLSYWDTEIAKKQVASKSLLKDTPLRLTMLTIDGPAWLSRDSPAASLLPPPQSAGPPIFFLGSSAASPTMGSEVRAELSDAIGRLSRAIPLFLAEETFFEMDAQVLTLVPWIVSGGGGFALHGFPWTEKDAVEAARRVAADARVVVITHIKASASESLVTARIVRCDDMAPLATVEVACAPGPPGSELLRLFAGIKSSLANEAGINKRAPPPEFSLPQGAAFGNYLLRLEQLLATRCAATGDGTSRFLSGEREIVSGMIRLCVDQPRNVPVRMILARTLQAMWKVNRAAVEEHREQIRLLQRQHPLADPAQRAIDEMLDELLGS